MSDHPRYFVRPVTTPVPERIDASTDAGKHASRRTGIAADGADTTEARYGADGIDPFIRAVKEDDDGYDPFSDRPPDPEPIYQEDPWK